jgi:hypothetical protein
MVCAVRDCESSLGSCCWRISSHIPVGMHGRVASLGPTLHTHLSTAPSTAFPPTFWPGERLSQLALLFSVLPFLIISPLRPALSACPGCFLHHLTTTQFACRCLRRRCCCWVEPIAAPQTVASPSAHLQAHLRHLCARPSLLPALDIYHCRVATSETSDDFFVHRLAGIHLLRSTLSPSSDPDPTTPPGPFVACQRHSASDATFVSFCKSSFQSVNADAQCPLAYVMIPMTCTHVPNKHSTNIQY